MARNCGSSTNRYSRPCCSCPRGLRVVCETERQYTKLSFSERLKLQLENLTASAKA